MLHAELHNKLSPDALDAERYEDILTSTVFGVLLTADGGQIVLREWLERSRFANGISDLKLAAVSADYRFWPRLEHCTPDAALSFGHTACVIEAKLLSGASDQALEDQAEKRQQLVTEWQACVTGNLLAAAFDRCDRFSDVVLLYVVDGVRGVRASKEAVVEARANFGVSRIGLLFWQDLHAILINRMDGAEHLQRWASDLALLLRRRQLGTFSGFMNRFNLKAARHSSSVRRWRQSGHRFDSALRGMDRSRADEVAQAIEVWRPRR